MLLQVSTAAVRFDMVDVGIHAIKPALSTFNRLETLPTGPDLDAGLQAAIADPLWMLARQWQFNELAGEDAGTPLSTRFDVQGLPVSAMFPGADIDQAPAVGLGQNGPPAEALVEQEPALARHPRFNAEAGLHLLRLIADQGPAPLADAARKAYPFALPAPSDPDSDSPGVLWHVVWGDGAIDAWGLAQALLPLADASGVLGALPPALDVAAADQDAARKVLAAWLAWMQDLVLEAPWPNPSWNEERMEYQFSMGAYGSGQPMRLQADSYTDGRLDWSTFDAATMSRQPPATPPDMTMLSVAKRHPAPVRYPGMPADRYWEYEDARVNFAGIEAGPTDITRMMITEFALAFGNDWFMVPLELRMGAVYRVQSFFVVDSFGMETKIDPSRNTDGSIWRMFELTGGAGVAAPLTDTLLLPAVADRALQGEPLEQVLLVRDEMANMAWGVEQIVQGACGDPIDRSLEAARLAVRQQLSVDTDDVQLVYRLASPVPATWIPLLPVRGVRPGAPASEIWLQRAALKRFYPLPEPLQPQPGDDAALRTYKEFLALLSADSDFITPVSSDDGVGIYLFHPRGRLLRADENAPVADNDDSLILCEEEVGSDGAIVQRAYQYARTPDGRAWLWVGRSKRTGRGEASSGLVFDTVIR
jgi:hypothetical protein